MAGRKDRRGLRGININHQSGISLLGCLFLLFLILIGGYLGQLSMELIGPEKFQSQARFLFAAYLVFLTPLWALFNQLNALKDCEGLDPRKAREIDFKAGRGINRIILMASVMIFGAVFSGTGVFWPSSPEILKWFSRITGCLLFLCMAFGVNVLFNLREVHDFGTKLSRTLQDQERRKILLEKMRQPKKPRHT